MPVAGGHTLFVYRIRCSLYGRFGGALFSSVTEISRINPFMAACSPPSTLPLVAVGDAVSISGSLDAPLTQAGSSSNQTMDSK